MTGHRMLKIGLITVFVPPSFEYLGRGYIPVKNTGRLVVRANQ